MSSKTTVKLYGKTKRIFECCASRGMTVSDLENAILKVVKKA